MRNRGLILDAPRYRESIAMKELVKSVMKIAVVLRSDCSCRATRAVCIAAQAATMPDHQGLAKRVQAVPYLYLFPIQTLMP